MSFDDFDQYCERNGITPDETPAVFAAWLNSGTGWDGPMSDADWQKYDDNQQRRAIKP